MKRSCIYLLLCSVFIASPLAAQVGGWTYRGSPSGMMHLTINCDAGGGLVVMDSINGIVYRSTNGGDKWDQSAPGPVMTIYASPRNILIGIGPDAIYNSADHGDHWEKVDTLPGRKMWTYADAFTANGTYVIATNYGMFVSSDNGATWSLGNGGTFDMRKIRTLISTGGDTLYAMETMYPGSGNLFYSTDAGHTWKVDQTLPSTSVPYSLAVDTKHNLYAGGQTGVIVKHPGANSWDALPITANSPSYADLLSAIGDNLIVITRGTTTSIHVSNDGGLTWRAQAAIPEAYNLRLVDARIYGWILLGNQRFFRSLDSGRTWQTFGPLFGGAEISAFASSNNMLFAGTLFNGIQRSTNEGIDWQEASAGIDTGNVDALVRSNFGLYAMINSTIYRSTDDAVTWSGLPTLISSSRPKHSITVDLSGKIILIAGDSLFTLAQGATSWSRILVQAGPQGAFAIDSLNNYYHILGSEGYLYTSSNGGSTWLRTDQSLCDGVECGPDLIINRRYPERYISADHGATWKLLKPPFVSYAIATLLRRGNRIAQMLSSDGLYETTDGGESWTLRDSYQYAFVLAEIGGHLIAATNENGIFGETLRSSVTHSDKLPLLAAYPNPATNGTLHVRLLKGESFSSFAIEDILGHEIASGALASSGSIASIELPHLASGLYRCRLTDGNHSQSVQFVIR